MQPTVAAPLPDAIPEATITPLQRLSIERDCTRLLLTYVALVDSGQVDSALDLFMPSAVVIGPRDAARLDGIAAIRAAFAARPHKAVRHFVSNILVEVLGSDRASVTANILLYTGQLPADGGLPHRDPNVAIGTTTDELVLTVDGWRFRERRGALCFAPA